MERRLACHFVHSELVQPGRNRSPVRRQPETAWEARRTGDQHARYKKRDKEPRVGHVRVRGCSSCKRVKVKVNNWWMDGRGGLGGERRQWRSGGLVSGPDRPRFGCQAHGAKKARIVNCLYEAGSTWAGDGDRWGCHRVLRHFFLKLGVTFLCFFLF